METFIHSWMKFNLNSDFLMHGNFRESSLKAWKINLATYKKSFNSSNWDEFPSIVQSSQLFQGSEIR